MSSSTLLGLGLSCVWIVHSLLISIYSTMTHTTLVSALSPQDETLIYTDNEFDHIILTELNSSVSILAVTKPIFGYYDLIFIIRDSMGLYINENENLTNKIHPLRSETYECKDIMYFNLKYHIKLIIIYNIELLCVNITFNKYFMNQFEVEISNVNNNRNVSINDILYGGINITILNNNKINNILNVDILFGDINNNINNRAISAIFDENITNLWMIISMITKFK
eukprot:284648_1